MTNTLLWVTMCVGVEDPTVTYFGVVPGVSYPIVVYLDVVAGV